MASTPPNVSFFRRLIAFLVTLVTFGDVLSKIADVVGLLSADYGTVQNRLGAMPLMVQAEFHTQTWFLYLVFLMALITITWYELSEQIIPNAVTIPGVVMGIALNYGLASVHIGIIASVLGATLWFAIPYIATRIWKESLGLGVVKMLSMIGAFLGPLTTLRVLVIGSILSLGVFGLLAMVGRKRLASSEELEIGPMLAVAACICVLFPHLF